MQGRESDPSGERGNGEEGIGERIKNSVEDRRIQGGDAANKRLNSGENGMGGEGRYVAKCNLPPPPPGNYRVNRPPTACVRLQHM